MIRPLTPKDADAFSRLRLLGLQLHPEAFGTGAAAWRAAAPEQIRSSLEAGDDPGDRFVLGAFGEEDELVGLLGFKRERRAAVHHKGSLWGFFVHPDHRRSGHGGRLLDTALDMAGACDGVEYVRLVVTTDDEDAVRLFESRGFARYGLESGGLRVNETAYDQAFLRCDVAGGDAPAV